MHDEEGLPLFVVLDCDVGDVRRKDIEPNVVDEEVVETVRRDVGLPIQDINEDNCVEDDTLIDYDSSDQE